MRYTWILAAALAASLVACESSNTRYGLTGDENTNSRATEYSGAKDSASPDMDADHTSGENKAADPSSDMPR